MIWKPNEQDLTKLAPKVRDEWRRRQFWVGSVMLAFLGVFVIGGMSIGLAQGLDAIPMDFGVAVALGSGVAFAGYALWFGLSETRKFTCPECGRKESAASTRHHTSDWLEARQQSDLPIPLPERCPDCGADFTSDEFTGKS